MKFFHHAALCAAILGSLTGSALAQGLGGAASISATGTSAAVALPLNPATTNYKSVIIAPAAGTSVEVFYALGGASAAASATPGTVAAAGSTPSAALPSGGICLNASGYTNVAAITGGSAATVRITQINGCTQFAGGGGSSGGGSTTANQGTAAAAGSAWPFYGTVSGAALSATNGWWTNILQGNAVLSASNPLFAAITDGTNKAAVKAASTAPVLTDPGFVVSESPNGFGAFNGSLTNPTGSTLTMTSATTAYTAGQLIATSATAGSVVNPSFSLLNQGASIQRIRISNNDTTSTAWHGQGIQIDLWTATPTWTNGDRGAWLPATGAGFHLGTYTCTLSATWGDGVACEASINAGSAAFPKLASGSTIYWSLNAVTGSGVTGASKVWTLIPELVN